MGDFEKALAECKRAQSEEREITDACARVIASMYHSGQASLGYSFASTGTIGEDSTPLWRELFDDYKGMSVDEKLLADMLGTYLVNADHPRGPVEGWSGLWL